MESFEKAQFKILNQRFWLLNIKFIFSSPLPSTSLCKHLTDHENNLWERSKGQLLGVDKWHIEGYLCTAAFLPQTWGQIVDRVMSFWNGAALGIQVEDSLEVDYVSKEYRAHAEGAWIAITQVKSWNNDGQNTKMIFDTQILNDTITKTIL